MQMTEESSPSRLPPSATSSSGYDGNDDGPLGLTELWPCSRACFEGGNDGVSIDIVAVHGLAGGSLSTWRHDNGKTWLLEFLPQDLPNARIMTFGYPARDAYLQPHNSGQKSYGRVMTVAETLCSDLSDCRTSQRQRPIVFIGHGVGGIIIKQALTYAKARSALFGDILQSTHHVLFFDSPHKGFDRNDWKAISGDNITSSGEEQFGVWSTLLSDLDRSFSEIGSNFTITSFLASQPISYSNGDSYAIRESSAILGFKFETPVQLDRTTHFTMCRYESDNDPGYRRVKNRLKAAINGFQCEVAATYFLLKGDDWAVKKWAADPKSLLEWVSTYDYSTDHDRLSKLRQQNTGGWILETPEFRKWFNGMESSCLWCSGIPGAGKTILTTLLVKEAQRRSSKTGIAVTYFYCDYAQPESLHASTIFASLFKQLLVHLDRLKKPCPPVIQEQLVEAYKNGQKRLNEDMIVGITTCFVESFFFIDGLDECEQNDIYEVLDFVRRLSTSPLRASSKIFIASRKELDVQGSIPSCISITASGSGLLEDIRQYVEKTVDDRIAKAGYVNDRNLVQYVKDKLIGGAQDMFLWVKFQIISIFDDCDSEDQIREAIEHLPRSLNETYLRCLQKISKRTQCSRYGPKILKWVICANRLLHIEELKEAVVFGPNDTKWDGSKIPKNNSRFISSCANLVVLDEIDDCVRLSHRTVKQFLFATSPIALPEMFRFRDNQIQLEIGEGCMAYLSFDDFRNQLATKSKEIIVPVQSPWATLAASNLMPKYLSRLPLWGGQRQTRLTLQAPAAAPIPPETFNKYHLLNYARNNWALHTIYISEKSPTWDTFRRLALELNESWKFHPWSSGKNTYAMHYSALFEWAVKNRHIPLLMLTRGLPIGLNLSDHANTKLQDGSFALHHASKQGFTDVVEIILNVCKVNMVDQDRKTALHWAAEKGRHEVVHLLLVKRAKIDAKSKDGRTALHWAAGNGHEAVVRLLLEKGADVDAKDKDGWTALRWAAGNGHEAVLQLLTLALNRPRPPHPPPL